MNDLQQVIEILRDYSQEYAPRLSLEVPLIQKIAHKMERREELVFLLPAFPAKSSNPLKTSGCYPDMGEVLALKNLEKLCQRISSFYKAGVKIIICSDGRVFGDVVNVSDESITMYQDGIEDIISDFNLIHLETFSLDDLYPELDGNELRVRLLTMFAKSTEEVRNLVCHDKIYRNLFNGLHRFLIEDESVLKEHLSKNQLSKYAKTQTYELIRRSDAWSALLNHLFKGELRLSIHPYELSHEKFGIKLVPSSDKWATPWHNVTVKINDKFELMHKQEALKRDAIPKTHKDKYVYFEIEKL